MDRLTDTQEFVCRAPAALGGTADAAGIGTHRGCTVAPPDLRRETRDLIDRGVVRVVGERDAADARPANVYALTGAGTVLAAGLRDDRPTPNELARDGEPRPAIGFPKGARNSPTGGERPRVGRGRPGGTGRLRRDLGSGASIPLGTNSAPFGE